MARPPRPPTRAPRASTRSIVERPDHIALLASSARQELVDTLDALGGEAVVAELAVQLGRPVAGLYYHLQLLARAGLIEELAGDGSARRYRVPPALRLRYRPGPTANARAVTRFAGGMLRVAQRDFAAAIRDPRVVVDGPRRTLWAARVKGWVGGAELTEINRLIARLAVLVSPGRAPGRDRLVALTWVLTPVHARGPATTADPARPRGRPRRTQRARPRRR
jgi:hypothetical protein